MSVAQESGSGTLMRRLSRAVTVVIVLGSLAAFGWVASNAFQSGGNLTDARWAPFAGAVVLHLSMLLLLMLFWGQLLGILGATVRGQGLKAAGPGLHTAYSRSWLARYIPGRVWALGGRMFLASKVGVPAEVVARSMALEVLFTYGLVSILGASLIVGVKVHPLAGIAVAVLGIVSFASGIPLAQNLLSAGNRRGFRHPLWRRFSSLVHRVMVGASPLTLRQTTWGISVYGLYACLQMGFIVLIAESFVDLTPQQAMIIAGGWGLSITLGWVSFLAPVGIGVRDGLAFVLFSQVMDGSTAGLIVTTSRLVMIATDLAFVGLVELLVLRLNFKQARRRTSPYMPVQVEQKPTNIWNSGEEPSQTI